RGGMLKHRPDMASLSTGSVNFSSIIYENSPQLIDELAALMLQYDVKPEIEVFDLAMIYNAAALLKAGKLKAPLHVQFVMGIPGAQPALEQILDFELSELKRLMPDATWVAAGIGRHQLEVNHWALKRGGHCRTGLEDNIKFDRDRLATSNAELVRRVAELCPQYGRHPASPAEARRILGLPS